MSQWHFFGKRPSDKTRDPVASEFFSQDAIKNAGEALVREAIQNSLDARVDRAGKTRIRIYVSGLGGALSPSRHRRWFDGAWPHYDAPKNGLRPGAVSPRSACLFLTFEDFNTTGLIGDRRQHEPVEGVPNAFFNFFRAEGKTDKGGDDRGRWGVGKQVFPRSSKAQSFFGYTETGDGGFLMGACILKHHNVGNTCYKPDGYWGAVKRVAGDDLAMPIDDSRVIDSFRKDFNLKRKDGEHGLSVVVPWLDVPEDPEDRSAFDCDTLALALIEGYFIPIIEGRLEASVEDPHSTLSIGRASYGDAINKIVARMGDRRSGAEDRLEALLELAEKANSRNVEVFDLGACPTSKPQWTDGMLPTSLAETMRDRLASGVALQVNATLTVRPKGGRELIGTLKCFLARDARLNHRPCHIREDIIVPNVDSPKIKGHSCIVRIDHGPLATLLGDAEGPAHTEWQASSRNFKDKYIFGGLAIQFVSGLPKELLNRIHSTSKQLDRTLLIDLFQDPEPETPHLADVGGPRPGPIPPQPPLPEPRRIGYRITETEAGFAVVSANGGLPRGTVLTISAAYETTKGNAFSAYNKNDFDLSGFQIEAEGCTHTVNSGNQVTLDIADSDFRIEVNGFDVNRDVVVKVNETRVASPELQ